MVWTMPPTTLSRWTISRGRARFAASLLSTLRAREAADLIREGVISRGMIPKVQACLDAIASGVPTAHIVSGTLPHALLVELFTPEGVGTMIVPD